MFKRRGEIVAVKDLFEKYRKTLQAPQKTVELEAIRVIGELTNITLKEHQISYTVSTRVLAINAPSVIKQELKFKHTELLSELKKRLGAKSSPQTVL
ncbi:MAG: hypothetical protein UW75_C0051G0003 [Parcubacteria group bacterium GW2011_GWF2_44_8]|nr:MAG: hypothetical protein UW75_C0051G0003 [Parcubacteria group bacterium GW2011_GWF2_44_8]